MQTKKYLKTGASLALVFFILAVVCINFFDKPLALYIHANSFDQWHVLSYYTENSILAINIFSFFILCIFPVDKSIWKRILLITIIIAGACLAIWIRRKLGVICARSWPQIWSGSGIYGGLIGDGQFGFHFFQTSAWKGSFPSGHSTEMAFICCVMYLAYHKYKYVWCLPVIMMVMGQVLQNFHFLGDCLAGVGLGVLVAYLGFAFYTWLVQQVFIRLQQPKSSQKN